MTPPQRFLDVLEGHDVACLTCRYPVLLDRAAYENTVSEIRRWQAAWPGKSVPPRLIRLVMRCLNSHLEVWHAEPPAITAEPASVRNEPTVEVECGCGRVFLTRHQEELCQFCRGRFNKKPRMSRSQFVDAPAAP